MPSIEDLEAATTRFEIEADLDFVDLSQLTGIINRLEGVRSKAAHRASLRGAHLLVGKSACSWVASECQMSKASSRRPALRRQAAGEAAPAGRHAGQR